MTEEEGRVAAGARPHPGERIRADRTDLLYKDIPEGGMLMRIEGLHVVYQTDEKVTVAVEDFSLDVKKGELVSIVGPSGCGKTTILRCIAGLLQPTSGRIMMGDRVCTAPGSDRGMVFQDFALFPWRTVRQNVEFGMEVAGVPKEEREKRALRYVEAVGLGRFADSRIHELSGGMKQRVGIARAMVMHPAVILMDEPFGALDAQTRNIMQEQLTRIIMHSTRTVIFITHSVDEALYLSDRVVILSKRPSRIHKVIDVPWPRPRDRASPEFTALRKRILAYLETENVMSERARNVSGRHPATRAAHAPSSPPLRALRTSHACAHPGATRPRGGSAAYDVRGTDERCIALPRDANGGGGAARQSLVTRPCCRTRRRSAPPPTGCLR